MAAGLRRLVRRRYRPGLGLARLGGDFLTTGGVVLFADPFTAANGTTLNGRTLPTGGGTWAAGAGTWTVTSNRAGESETDGTLCVLTQNAALADVTVQADVVVPASPSYRAGLVLRAADASNFLFLAIENSGDPDILLVEVSGGTQGGSAIGNDQAPDDLSGQTVTLKAVCAGTTISVYINDVLRFTATGVTQQQTSTRFGLAVSSSLNLAAFDNYQLST